MNKNLVTFVTLVLLIWISPVFSNGLSEGPVGEQPEQTYLTWAKDAIEMVRNAPGFIEFRAFRNMFGSPQVRAISVWTTLSAWAMFAESVEWQNTLSELRDKYATNICVEIWKVSPVAPTPLGSLRPGEKEIVAITRPGEGQVYIEVHLTYDLLPNTE